MADIELTITEDEEVARHVSSGGWSGTGLRMVRDAITAALPKPRPAEPMGLGAVVRDGEGRAWVRTGDDSLVWRCPGGHRWKDYEDLRNPIEVLSEGVIL